MYGCEGALLSLIVLSLPLTAPHVVLEFSDVPECEQFFLDKTPPEIAGILVGGYVQDQNRYKVICQFFYNTYRFATLYDTSNRIPVFSAYKFIGKNENTTRNKVGQWYIEPQLEEPEKEMMLANKYENQATLGDYKNSINTRNVNKGHLFPKLHASDQNTANSTFTLTNVVPQNVAFNRGAWNQMENNVTDSMSTYCSDTNGNIEAYVVTGAVPGSQTLADRVNIPKLMWTAFCCETKDGKWMSKAHWGENVNTTETLETKTVTELQEKLKEAYGADMVHIFPAQCKNGHLSFLEKFYLYHRHMFHEDPFEEHLLQFWSRHRQRKHPRILHSDK